MTISPVTITSIQPPNGGVAGVVPNSNTDLNAAAPQTSPANNGLPTANLSPSAVTSTNTPDTTSVTSNNSSGSAVTTASSSTDDSGGDDQSSSSTPLPQTVSTQTALYGAVASASASTIRGTGGVNVVA